jgi:hypothetical protein
MKLLLVVLLVACTGRHHGPVGIRVRCDRDQGLANANQCGEALRRFAREHPTVRVSGINALYSSTTSLVVWTSDDSAPKANDLTIDVASCATTASGADCQATIGGLLLAARNKHVATVPLYSMRGKTGGTWDLLNVTTRSASPTEPSLVEVPCRVDKGDPLLGDDGQGVMLASEFGRSGGVTVSPSMCEQALLIYLRAHPDLRVVDIFSQDKAVAETPMGSMFPGTGSLLVMTGADGVPARELSVRQLGCELDADCADLAIEVRGTSTFARARFGTPIAETHEAGTNVTLMLMVSKI